MRPQKESQKDRDVRIKQLYDKLNTRQEDSLDLSSLIEGLKKINHPLQDDQGVLKEILRSADLDGDGRVTFVEFKTFMEKSEMHLFQLFQSIDRDRNGNLSMEEVEHALLQASVTVSKKNLQAFFKSVDTDNDGEITFEEWRDFLLFTPHSSLTINAVYAYYQATHMSSEGDITLSDKALHGMGDFIAGGIAGAVSRTCTAPLDRLKVYLISQTSSEKRISSTMKSRISKAVYVPSKNLLKAMIQIYREGGGMRSFFVGNGLNVVKIFPESAIKFGVFEASKRVLAQMEGLPRESLGDLSSLSGYLAGGLAGSVSQFAIYPIDTLKFRLQCECVQGGDRGNVLLCMIVKSMWSNGGIRNFYRGLPVGLIGTFPYAAIDLGTFEGLKKAYIKAKAKRLRIPERKVQPGNFVVLGIGALSGSIGASLVYPLNVLRTRLQTQGTAAHCQQYAGIRDVFQKTVKNEGYRGLFRGLLPNLLKVAPAVSISYVLWENLRPRY